jgi:hypothetical protein
MGKNEKKWKTKTTISNRLCRFCGFTYARGSMLWTQFSAKKCRFFIKPMLWSTFCKIYTRITNFFADFLAKIFIFLIGLGIELRQKSNVLSKIVVNFESANEQLSKVYLHA